MSSIAQTRAQEPSVKPAAKKAEDGSKAKSVHESDAKPSSEKDAKADSSPAPAADAPAAAKDQPKPKAQNDAAGDNTPAVLEPRNAGQILKVAKINPPSGSIVEDASNPAAFAGERSRCGEKRQDGCGCRIADACDGFDDSGSGERDRECECAARGQRAERAPVAADSPPDTSSEPTAPADDLKLMAPALKATPQAGAA